MGLRAPPSFLPPPGFCRRLMSWEYTFQLPFCPSFRFQPLSVGDLDFPRFFFPCAGISLMVGVFFSPFHFLRCTPPLKDGCECTLNPIVWRLLFSGLLLPCVCRAPYPFAAPPRRAEIWNSRVGRRPRFLEHSPSYLPRVVIKPFSTRKHCKADVFPSTFRYHPSP